MLPAPMNPILMTGSRYKGHHERRRQD